MSRSLRHAIEIFRSLVPLTFVSLNSTSSDIADFLVISEGRISGISYAAVARTVPVIRWILKTDLIFFSYFLTRFQS